MTVTVVTVHNEGDVDVLVFNKVQSALHPLKVKAKEWVDEDTDEAQDRIITYIESIQTFKMLCEFVFDKFNITIESEEQEVIE